MEYQALYRKYRPKNFDEVSGQNISIKILKNSIINNKISHAYLFYGPRGTGKTSVAKIFARAVNCSNINGGIQCEECNDCKISSEKECVDIVEIDAASNNGVEEIRDLKAKVSFVPSELRYKVYIIDEVHMLSMGAFNALLKTLEEPPAYVIFILATTELRKVPATIISRCQTLEFKKLDVEDIANRLDVICSKEKIKIDKEAELEIARYSNGGLRDSIGLLEKANNYCDGKITKEDVKFISNNISTDELDALIENIKEKNIQKIIDSTDEYNKRGIDYSKVINDLIDVNLNEMIKNKNYSRERCELIKKLDDINSNIKTSENPKLIFEISLINLILQDKNNNEIKLEIKEKDNKQEIGEKKVEAKAEEKKDIIKENNSNKEIRVGNTLAKADKNIISEIRTKWKNIQDLAFDTKYGNIARLLTSDIIPVAASDEYIVLTAKMQGLANEINGDLLSVEKIIEIVFNNKYKTICITENEWKEYIKKYKEDKNSFKYREEELKVKKTLKEKAKELFED